MARRAEPGGRLSSTGIGEYELHGLGSATVHHPNWSVVAIRVVCQTMPNHGSLRSPHSHLALSVVVAATLACGASDLTPPSSNGGGSQVSATAGGAAGTGRAAGASGSGGSGGT